MFRVGDKVWSCVFGHGTVTETEEGEYSGVKVTHSNGKNFWYNEEGVRPGDEIRTLFFQEIPIPKEALERPEWRADVNQVYFTVLSTGRIDKCPDKRDCIDDDRFRRGNYFSCYNDAIESKFFKIFRESFIDREVLLKSAKNIKDSKCMDFCKKETGVNGHDESCQKCSALMDYQSFLDTISEFDKMGVFNI